MIVHNKVALAAMGAFDPAIKEQQQLLAAAGFDPGPIDGVDGQRTAAAWGRALDAGMPSSLDDAKAWLRQRAAARSTTPAGGGVPPSAAPFTPAGGKFPTPLLIGAGAAAIAALYFFGGSK